MTNKDKIIKELIKELESKRMNTKTLQLAC